MKRVNTAPGVPRRAVLTTCAVPLVTLPSGLWRIALVVGVPVTVDPVRTGWGALYVVALTLVSEAFALLTLGLVQPWGEVVPRWIPLIGGRAVHPLAAVVPALLGAAALFMLSGLVGWVQIAHLAAHELTESGVQDALLIACYAPLLAWAPLLTVSALAYHRRRTTAPPPPRSAPAHR